MFLFTSSVIVVFKNIARLIAFLIQAWVVFQEARKLGLFIFMIPDNLLVFKNFSGAVRLRIDHLIRIKILIFFFKISPRNKVDRVKENTFLWFLFSTMVEILRRM